MPAIDPDFGDRDAIGQASEAVLERVRFEPVFGQDALDQSENPLSFKSNGPEMVRSSTYRV